MLLLFEVFLDYSFYVFFFFFRLESCDLTVRWWDVCSWYRDERDYLDREVPPFKSLIRSLSALDARLD